MIPSGLKPQAWFYRHFQQEETGRAVLRNLRRDGFGRSALLHALGQRKTAREWRVGREPRLLSRPLLALSSGPFCSGGNGCSRVRLSALGIALILTGFVLGGVLVGWFVFRLLEKRPHALGRAKFRRSILPNETMVMVESAPDDTSRVLEILRDVGDDPSVLFAFHSTAEVRI